MPKCYMLIGIPGIGKSTWVSQQSFTKDCAYVSTDAWVELEAERVGKTYSEVFKDYMPRAVNLMAAQVVDAREQCRDIIWDQTSTTVESRAKKFRMLPDYEHIAVVFKAVPKDELLKRLNSRPGKEIPWEVIDQMIIFYKTPTKEEGFSEIWYIA